MKPTSTIDPRQNVIDELTRIANRYRVQAEEAQATVHVQAKTLARQIEKVAHLEATILEQSETIEQLAAELERLRDAGG